MSDTPRIVVWGTYDLGKPRVRILLRGLREQGMALHECHADVWSQIEDKSQLLGAWPRLRLGIRWLLSYPRLLWCYLNAPAHDWVLVPYLGHLDVLVIWLFARLRRARVAWDVFVPLYEAVVEDRGLLRKGNPLAWLLYGWEWLACRAAHLVILDTRAHAGYFRAMYRLHAQRVCAVMVGVEPERFPRQPAPEAKCAADPRVILFYGQFIPLHGVDTIIEAARLLDDGTIRWVLIGKGQEEGRIREMLAAHPVVHLEWHPWVPYEELIAWIRHADICLGIFGDSPKAARVVPNKVFQVLAAGRPLISRDSPALRELPVERHATIRLIPAADAQALVDAVSGLSAQRAACMNDAASQNVLRGTSPVEVGRALRACLEGLS